MLADAKNEDLMYVSDGSDRDVLVYSYQSRSQVGQLGGFYEPYGQCVDANGDVWITDDRLGTVTEYAHGGTVPIRTLRTPRAGPIGCSIAPNGDLAVSIDRVPYDTRLEDGPAIDGEVLVFKDASGAPARYHSRFCTNPGSPGYDFDGHLYVEGQQYVGTSTRPTINVCELAVGERSLRAIAVYGRSGSETVHLRDVGSIMWDGKHVTITNAGSATLLATNELPGGDLRVVSASHLRQSVCLGVAQLNQVFLVGGANPPVNHSEATAALAGSDSAVGSCDVYLFGWAYPGGGTERWSLGVRDAFGESVSLAKR